MTFRFKILLLTDQCCDSDPAELVELITKLISDARLTNGNGNGIGNGYPNPESQARPPNISRQISDRSQASLDFNWFTNPTANRWFQVQLNKPGISYTLETVLLKDETIWRASQNFFFKKWKKWKPLNFVISVFRKKLDLIKSIDQKTLPNFQSTSQSSQISLPSFYHFTTFFSSSLETVFCFIILIIILF